MKPHQHTHRHPVKGLNPCRLLREPDISHHIATPHAINSRDGAYYRYANATYKSQHSQLTAPTMHQMTSDPTHIECCCYLAAGSASWSPSSIATKYTAPCGQVMAQPQSHMVTRWPVQKHCMNSLSQPSSAQECHAVHLCGFNGSHENRSHSIQHAENSWQGCPQQDTVHHIPCPRER